MVKAIYVHIPFCISKCSYCDFNSYPLGNQSLKGYLNALEKEMKMLVELNPSESIQTIFIGGGTPTILKPKELEYLLGSIDEYFPYRENEFEYTIEANPGTLDSDKLNIIKDFGINRISMGAQAFQDLLLRSIGRIHTEKDIYHCIEAIKKAGINNINIDLMFGLPNQTISMFKDSLEKFFKLDIEHASVYSLIIEENTEFYNLYKENKLSLPSDEDELMMYLLTLEEMEKNNYIQYEISNFSKQGFQSKHNLNYWRNKEYIGLGAGAHGYINNLRYENLKGIKEYIAALSKQTLPRNAEQFITTNEKKENMLMLGLRMNEGVSLLEYEKLFNEDLRIRYKEQIRRLNDSGLIIIDDNCIKLSNKGLLYGNEVFAEFIHSDD